MNAEQKLQQLCRKHGLARSEADDVLPLVQRGLNTAGTIGRCLLAVAEASLATRAGKRRNPEVLRETLEDRVLVALAGVLHHWEPGAPESGGSEGSGAGGAG